MEKEVEKLKTTLTLQEKLRDVRKLTLAELSNETGIPTTTLQRFESDEDARIGYQDVEVLTRFYGVSADYLFGLTDNRQYRNIEIDKLHLSDEAIAELTSGKLNNRLLSDVIAHPDFAELLAGLEVFINRSVSEYIEVINKTYKVAADTISIKKITDERRDEYMATLKEVSIDPDDYLRFRLSQRFEKLAQGLYDKHEKESYGAGGKISNHQKRNWQRGTGKACHPCRSNACEPQKDYRRRTAIRIELFEQIQAGAAVQETQVNSAGQK